MSRPESGPEPVLSEALVALWERYRGAMDERIDAVDRAAQALLAGGLDAETRRAGEREAHKLAGAVGTFGFAEGSRLAREAEDLLMGDAPLDPDAVRRLAELVAALRTELSRAIR
jgi:HPt (histidine-containing phosphotransfer) domain-containing protein